MLAASSWSCDSDCSAVSRISAAKGSHCQATMMVIASIGACPNQSTTGRPRKREICAKMP
jgi:hypothetical protein